MRSRFPRFLAVLVLVFLQPSLTAAPSPIQSPHELKNLEAFARAYGYVRFFHPSDEAAEVDWDKLAMVGLESVRTADHADALRTRLLDVLGPLAPELQVTLSRPEARSQRASRGPATYWQYQGINLSPDRSVYQQRRVVVEKSLPKRQPLFEQQNPPERLIREIGARLWIEMPLTLPIDDDGRTHATNRPGLVELERRLEEIDLQTVSTAGWRVRLAGVIVVWNVFQHFHPYLDQAGIDWSATLAPALQEALEAEDAAGYNQVLSALVAKSNDGHGYVYGPGRASAGLPLRFAWIDDELIISGVEGEDALQKGGIVETLDGRPAAQALADVERRSPGSPHLRRFRALNALGEGPPESKSTLAVRRGATRSEVVVARQPSARGYFFKSVPEFVLPGFAEVRRGIYHINLSEIGAEEFESKKAMLQDARGIIFDWRFSGERKARTENRRR